MGKNRKEQAAYDYLHENKPVRGRLLWSILNKWWRYNSEAAEFRMLRRREREKDADKDLKRELEEEKEK